MPEQQLENEQFFRRNGEKARVRAGHGLQSYIQVRLVSNVAGRISSLDMKRTATPFFRGDVGDSLSEVPAVAMEVLSIVLALPVRLVFRFG